MQPLLQQNIHTVPVLRSVLPSRLRRARRCVHHYRHTPRLRRQPGFELLHHRLLSLWTGPLLCNRWWAMEWHKKEEAVLYNHWQSPSSVKDGNTQPFNRPEGSTPTVQPIRTLSTCQRGAETSRMPVALLLPFHRQRVVHVAPLSPDAGRRGRTKG